MRCGAALYERHNFHFARLPRYHNAPRDLSAWKSVPFIVRLAIYAVSGMVLLSFGFWLLMVLAIFGPPSPHP
jgi:nitrate reductase NapE component